MANNKGWIKLHRSIQDCFLWNDKPYDKCRAWIDLLLLANHEDKKLMFNGTLITVSRGQYLTSIRKLSERWGWSKDKVVRHLLMLESEEMIHRDSNNNRTLLTIVNYGVYQDSTDSNKDSGNDTDNDTDNDTNKLQTRNKEYKELKNEINIYNAPNEIDSDGIDLGEWYLSFVDLYPRKTNNGLGKYPFMDFFKGIERSDWVEVAKEIDQALQLYIKDYQENNPEDSTYQYVPSIEKWLTLNAEYWIREVRKARKNESK